MVHGDPLIGTVIGDRYALVDVVGRGGMGIVYRAEDLRLSSRPCAIKLLSGKSMDPDEAARFARELSIISRLRSPNVVQVMDTGNLTDGRAYIVMELLEGLPLSGLLRETGPLASARAVSIAKGVLGALAEAHEFGIVHRDLKPANVFITHTRSGSELVKVLDFGIAKETRADRAEDLTAASMLIGTPKYMAPEQFLKKAADPRTDLYAVGLLLYQMMAGEAPFHSGSMVPASIGTMPEEFRIGWLHINQEAPPLSLPPGLWEVLSGLLAKQPEQRYATAEDAIAALSSTGGSQPVTPMTGGFGMHRPGDPSSPTGFPVFGEAPSRPVGEHEDRRSRMPMYAAMGIGAVAAAAVAAWYLNKTEPAPPVRTARVAICADQLVTEPGGASVYQGAVQLGQTPLTIERPCREVWMVRVEREGHLAQTVHLRGREPNGMTKVQLKAVLEPDAAVAPAVDAAVVAPPIEKKPKRRWKSKRKKTPPKPKPKPKPKPEASPLPF